MIVDEMQQQVEVAPHNQKGTEKGPEQPPAHTHTRLRYNDSLTAMTCALDQPGNLSCLNQMYTTRQHSMPCGSFNGGLSSP